jgi:hypothetical protein
MGVRIRDFAEIIPCRRLNREAPLKRSWGFPTLNLGVNLEFMCLNCDFSGLKYNAGLQIWPWKDTLLFSPWR